jgi:hypothetical protein
MSKIISVGFLIAIGVLFISAIVNFVIAMYNEAENRFDITTKKNHKSFEKFNKNEISIPNKYSQFLSENPLYLVKNKKYALVQEIENDKCFLGYFNLKYMDKYRLVFKANGFLNKSRLAYYAKIKSLDVKTLIFSDNEFREINIIQQCEDWVKIEKK